MVFWNRDSLPPELEGKKPEEIVEALRKLKELETKSAEYETAKKDLETKFHTQSTEYEQAKQRLQEIEAGIQEAQRQAEAQQKPPEPANIWNDPDNYINKRMEGTQVMSMAAIRMVSGMKFQQSLSGRERKIFDKYSNEVEQVMNGYPPQYQGLPQNWETAFLYVKGRHEQDISKAESEGSSFFSEPGSRGAPPEAEPGADEKLTAEEDEACRKFHWDPKGYLQRKKEMNVYQSERGSYARFPVPERTRS